MKRRLKNIILLVVIIMTSSFFQLQKSEVEEYSAKAAFIYNFTKFVEWENGEEASAPFVIGVVGESSIYKPLLGLAQSKKINNRKIEIIKFNTVADVSACQILFVPETSSHKNLKDCVDSKYTKHTLIITEKQGYLEYGSGINFMVVDNRIKFEINIASLTKANIKASSQLLKLAQNVQE